MEKSENRMKYIDDLQYFIDNVKLTPQLINKLKSHEYFQPFLKELWVNLTNDDKKLFVLLELTRERSTCAAVVKILRECNQKDVAARLEKFNTSTGPMELSTEVEIPVAKGAAPILGRSNTYTLIKRPRGKCIIINNVEEQQTPDIYDKKSGNHIFTPKGLKRETIRFEHIFNQLYFDVRVLTNLSAAQMNERLTQISREENLRRDEAFVLITISHGQDKKVLGYNACEAMRKISFGLVKPGTDDMNEATQEMDRDSIGIKDIVSIFAEDKCPNLMSKPKLFFFICCRNKDIYNSDKAQNRQSYENIDMKPNEIKEPVYLKDGKLAKNLDTFVSYSCAQGCESNYSCGLGMSYFGLAFTQAIAQYACDESLAVIMHRTSERLKNIYAELKVSDEQKARLEGRAPVSDLTIGSFAIQVNTYAMDRQLYFNPGFTDKK